MTCRHAYLSSEKSTVQDISKIRNPVFIWVKCYHPLRGCKTATDISLSSSHSAQNLPKVCTSVRTRVLGNSAFTVRPHTWKPADLPEEAPARGVRGKPKTSSTPNGLSELKVPVLRCSNKYIRNKNERRKRNCGEMRVFSCLQGVRAKETAPGCLHPSAWGPLLGHLPTSPAPGWPAARVPVGPGTPPSPREAAARGEGCARLSWADHVLPPPRAISRMAKTSHGARWGQDTAELQLTGLMEEKWGHRPPTRLW